MGTQMGVAARIALKGQPKSEEILRNFFMEISSLHLAARQCRVAMERGMVMNVAADESCSDVR